MFKLMITTLITVLFLSCSSHNAKAPIQTKMDSPYIFPSLGSKAKAYYSELVQEKYNSILGKSNFNGSILVAKNGEIVFEDYKGTYNFKTKEPITENTPFHLASISKTFTAMTILHLYDEGKLSLDDKVSKWIDNFPYNNITIKNLLTHRSGLANYVHFMDENKVEVIRHKNKRGKMIISTRVIGHSPRIYGLLSNADVVKYMVSNNIRPQGSPDHSFNYCNTNYILLAMIVEKVTGMYFPQFMKDSLFTPLGMSHSFIFNIQDTAKYVPSYEHNNRPFMLEKFDCIYGDKNVYSTVRDMLLWDKALYAGTYVSKQTLDMAFKPYSNERRSMHNYGLGWRLLVKPDETIVYHNGWWHGNNTVFTRLIKDTATIIVLGNKFNRIIYKSKEITSVFSNAGESLHDEE